jgi:hypothetical protein
MIELAGCLGLEGDDVEVNDLIPKKNRRIELDYNQKLSVNYIQLLLLFYTCSFSKQIKQCIL